MNYMKNNRKEDKDMSKEERNIKKFNIVTDWEVDRSGEGRVNRTGAGEGAVFEPTVFDYWLNSYRTDRAYDFGKFITYGEVEIEGVWHSLPEAMLENTEVRDYVFDTLRDMCRPMKLDAGKRKWYTDEEQIVTLKQFRKQQGLTQKQLAASLEISVSYLSMMEKGTRVLSEDVVDEIRDLYGVEVG